VHHTPCGVSPGPAARVALNHPEWLASKMIIQVHSPRGGGQAETLVPSEKAVIISAYSPRVVRRMNSLRDR
jgi:hypothetical protein